MSLYEKYKLRKELIEKGIRKDIADWVECFFSFSLCKDYLQADFKNYQIVANHPTVPVSKAIKLKKKFMSFGMDEETAENWIAIGLHMPDRALEFYEKGYDYNFAEKMLKDRRTPAFVEKVVNLFMSYGYTREEVLQEMVYWISERKISYDELLKYLEMAKRANFATPHFLMWTYMLSEAKTRIDFYKSLGFSQVQAEWWTACEIDFGGRFSEEEVKKLLSHGINTFKDLRKIASIKTINPGISVDELIRWHRIGVDNPDEWKRLGHMPETAEKWHRIEVLIPKGLIDYEEFMDLLEESWCDAKELAEWLAKVGYNVQEVREYMARGIKDYYTWKVLRRAGFGLEELDRALSVFSLEEVFRKIDEGMFYEDMLSEISFEESKKHVVKSFKSKLRKVC